MAKDDEVRVPWPSGPGKIRKAAGDSWVPWPFSGEPVEHLIKDLIGRKLRVSSGVVTTEIDPGRVTILTDSDGVIRDIYVDPDKPKI